MLVCEPRKRLLSNETARHANSLESNFASPADPRHNGQVSPSAARRARASRTGAHFLIPLARRNLRLSGSPARSSLRAGIIFAIVISLVSLVGVIIIIVIFIVMSVTGVQQTVGPN